MESNGSWSFAPVYNLIFTNGPDGEHSCTVAGEGCNPTMKDIIKLAELSDISSSETFAIVDEVQTALNCWKPLALELDIDKTAIKQISKALHNT